MLKTTSVLAALSGLCFWFTLSVQGQVSVPATLTVFANTREAVEGQKFAIGWEAGPAVTSITALYRADRTPLGNRDRGTQSEVIAEHLRAGSGGTTWIVPWIDSLRFRIYLKGFNAVGELIGGATIPLRFRPRELAAQTRDAIYVDLSHRARQRLYRQQNHELVLVAICSGSYTNYRITSHNCPRRIHDHLGWFHIIQKDRHHVSTLNPEWKMPYAMRFHRAHFIHATSRSMYRYLGHPASHGCIRLHRVDAKRLFSQSRVEDWVYIY